MEDLTMVPGEPNGGVADATPAGGVAAPVASTPTTPPADAESAAMAARQAELENQVLKTTEDLNRIKSTFQRREAEQQREWADREKAYQIELERLRVSGMDEEQRKAYEASASSRRLQELEQQMNALQEQKAQTDAMLKAQNWFLTQGVPADRLNLDGGYEEMWNSGMEYLTSELHRLRTQPPATSTPAQPRPAQQAPPVVTTTATPAYTGPTWADLVKTYGSEEEVYRLVETGRLDPKTIPMPR